MPSGHSSQYALRPEWAVYFSVLATHPADVGPIHMVPRQNQQCARLSALVGCVPECSLVPHVLWHMSWVVGESGLYSAFIKGSPIHMSLGEDGSTVVERTVVGTTSSLFLLCFQDIFPGLSGIIQGKQQITHTHIGAHTFRYSFFFFCKKKNPHGYVTLTLHLTSVTLTVYLSNMGVYWHLSISARTKR